MQPGRRRRLPNLLTLIAALALGMACSSNSAGNSHTTNASATVARPQAASQTAAASASRASSPAAAAGTPGGTASSNSAEPQSVIDADKAMAAAAGTGSPVDSVTISRPVTIQFWHVQ